MARAIFISYRRDDSEGEAGRLFDDLVRTYGDDSVFMDVSGINPGTDFRKAIDDNVATCGVLLAIIGPTWTAIVNSSGQRRLDDPNDFVRLEIASALARQIPVIPVLVHDAKMPVPDQLPDNLKDFAYRNSVELSHARWNSDVQLLTAALRQYVTATDASSSQPVHATVPVQLPPTSPSPSAAVPAPRSKTPMMAGISLGVVVAIAVAVFAAIHSKGGNQPQPPAPVPTPAPAPSPTPVAASTESPLAGTWINPRPAGKNGLSKLQITVAGRQLSIHAWGYCNPTDCDWGQQSSTFDGQKATATWNLLQQRDGEEKGRLVAVTVTPANDALQVHTVNTYPNHPMEQFQFRFTRSQ